MFANKLWSIMYRLLTKYERFRIRCIGFKKRLINQIAISLVCLLAIAVVLVPFFWITESRLCKWNNPTTDDFEICEGLNVTVIRL